MIERRANALHRRAATACRNKPRSRRRRRRSRPMANRSATRRSPIPAHFFAVRSDRHKARTRRLQTRETTRAWLRQSGSTPFGITWMRCSSIPNTCTSCLASAREFGRTASASMSNSRRHDGHDGQARRTTDFATSCAAASLPPASAASARGSYQQIGESTTGTLRRRAMCASSSPSRDMPNRCSKRAWSKRSTHVENGRARTPVRFEMTPGLHKLVFAAPGCLEDMRRRSGAAPLRAARVRLSASTASWRRKRARFPRWWSSSPRLLWLRLSPPAQTLLHARGERMRGQFVDRSDRLPIEGAANDRAQLGGRRRTTRQGDRLRV